MTVAPRWLILVAALSLTGCTSTKTSSTSSAPGATTTATHTSSRNSPPLIDSGPTKAHPASSCPFVTQNFVRDAIGMRQGRITILRRGGRTVGCRFYALQGSPLSQSEHLPGPNQPVVEITTRRYASAVAAHNAFVRTADNGRSPEQAPLGGGIVAVCFQTAFYPRDHGADWACATSVRKTEVVVRTAVTSPAFDAIAVTRKVVRGL